MSLEDRLYRSYLNRWITFGLVLFWALVIFLIVRVVNQ